MGLTVGVNKAVAAKVMVVVFFAPVAAVAVFNLSFFGFAHYKAVVAPFPDKAAAKPVGAVEKLMIIFQVARAVTHGMAVFAQNKRSLFLFVLGHFFPVFYRRIHPGN